MMPLRRRLVLAAAAVGIALVAWLGMIRLSAPRMIDGYPVGAPAGCAERCQTFSDAASAWLDTAVPGHGPIEKIELFEPDYRDANGNTLLTNRSGGRDYIAVIQADGRIRAIQVGCGVGVDYERCFTSPPLAVP